MPASTDLVDWERPRRRARPRRAGALGRPGAVDRFGRARRRRHLADVLHGAEHRRRARRARPADRRRGVRRPARRGGASATPDRRARPALVSHARRRRERDLARPVRLPGGRHGWHMLITARDPDAPRLLRRRDRPRHERGHARVGAPAAALRAARGFGQLEVAAGARGRRRAGCSASPATPRSRAPRRSRGRTAPGRWSRTGPLGPFDLTRRGRSPPSRSCSPRRSSRHARGEWVFVGFRNTEPEGVPAFHIIDPVPRLRAVFVLGDIYTRGAH